LLNERPFSSEDVKATPEDKGICGTCGFCGCLEVERMLTDETALVTGVAAGYPAYAPITVDGMTEMIENRGAEPVFYMTDDSVVF
jgi:hypothetical protein